MTAPTLAPEPAYEVVCSSHERDTWLAHRRSGIGASEIAAVLGESPWLSAIELYAEKIGASAPRDLSDSEPVYWGVKLERNIIEGYCERTGRPVERSGNLLRSRAERWALATLDAETGERAERWPLEVKNVGLAKADQWEQGPPRHYYLQVQHQLLVTGAPRATIACLIGGQRMVWCDVERDEVEIRRIIYAGRIFWEQCVEQGLVPKPDASSGASRALAALYPHAEDTHVVLSGEYEALYTELADLKGQLNALETRRAEIENQFRAALGTAKQGILPASRNSVTWAEQRGAIDYKRVAEALGADAKLLEQYRRANIRVLRQHDAKGR